MKKDVTIITYIGRNGNCFDTYGGYEIQGLIGEIGMYTSVEGISGKLDDLLKNLRSGNKYGIQIADAKRKGDRVHKARYYSIPYRSVAETVNYGDARDLVLGNMNSSIYVQEDGHGYLVINAGATAIIERLYVIKHEIQDGSLPFYYDRKGNQVYSVSFSYDMFFSAYKQAMDQQTRMFDQCTHIETVFADPRFDPRNLCE